MSQPAGYRHLDEVQILATLVRLRDRIGERFPGSGLSRIADELLSLGNQTAAFIGPVAGGDQGTHRCRTGDGCRHQ